VIDLLFVILIVIAAVLLLEPNHSSRMRNKGIKIRCVYNLKEIGTAFRDWVPTGEKVQDPIRFPMAISTNNGGVAELVTSGEVFRIFQVLSNQLTNTHALICPVDKKKSAKDFVSLKNENLSYFVGLDADESMPQMFLCGDRNLIINGVPAHPGLELIKNTDTLGWAEGMHRFQGTVLLADGSVQQTTPSGLQRLAGQTGTNITRLAIP
jgi:hypothetical protein